MQVLSPEIVDKMPLFIVKKEIFEWIINKQKNIELKKGKTEKGDVAEFVCKERKGKGKWILRRKIIKTAEGNLTVILKEDNYKNVIPSANSLEEAVDHIEKLHGTTKGDFTAYYFKQMEVQAKEDLTWIPRILSLFLVVSLLAIPIAQYTGATLIVHIASLIFVMSLILLILLLVGGNIERRIRKHT